MDLNNVEFTWIKNKPVNWKIHRLKNHFVLTKNKTDSPEGYPILSLTMRGIIERDISSNEGQLPETYNGYNLLEKDDIVFNPMDLISGWVDCSPYEGLISPSYKVIRPISSEVYIKFYTYYFQTHYKEKIFFPFGEGIHYEYRWGLGTETLKNFPIVVPPLHEQQQIVSFLDNKTSLIDSLIEKTQLKIELLKEKRNSFINEVVTKGLNPNVEMKNSGLEWIGEIPVHWELIRLNNLGDFSKGKGITKDKIKESGHKCIRCGEIYTTYELRFSETNSFIDDETSSESVLGFKGVLLFTGDGESLEEIGKCVVYEGEEELYIGGGINVFTPNQEKVIPIYLSYVMSSESVIFQKSRQGKGEIVVHIYSKQLKEIRMGLPPLKEQQQIVEYLDEKTQGIDKTISIEEKRIELLKEYRQSLISEVVTGKLKVTTDE